MKKFLFYLALTGWLLSLAVHLLSIAGIDTTGKMPFVWLLHIGIFAVWIAVVLDLINNEELKQFKQSNPGTKKKSFAAFKIIFKDAPGWMQIVVIVSFIYMPINLFLFSTTQNGSPDFRDGQYILHNRGEIISTITEQEYHRYKAREIRGFSGHWIFFYAVATAVLFKYSGFRRNN